MDVDDRRNGRRRSRLSIEKNLELEWLDALRNELQAEYDRLYIDHKNLRSRHEEAVRNAKELERKQAEMDNRAYRKTWRKFFEEEIALQELGATIRQYAEEVRKRREVAWEARRRLMEN